jgi:cytoplasmic tRNA 2-thiolation protein 2
MIASLLIELDSLEGSLVVGEMAKECVKCKNRPGTLDIRFAVYCAECFKEATQHKFRSGLARCWPVRTRPAALLFLQTAENAACLTFASRLLLHFTQLPGIEEPQRRNLTQWQPVLPIACRRDIRTVLCLARALKTCYGDLERIYVLPLAVAVAVASVPIRCVYQAPGEDEDEDELLRVLEALPWEQTAHPDASRTVQEDLARLLFRRLLLGLMAESRVSRCLLAESSTACAVAAIAAMSKGRGRAVPFQSGYVLEFPGELQLLKPMRDISDREISLYVQTDATLKDCSTNSGCSSEPETRDTRDSIGIDSGTGIDGLTASFITGLENDFPGTASTVLRTIDKIHHDNANGQRCRLCLEPMDGAVDQDAQLCEPCARILEEARLAPDSLLLPALQQ